MQARTAPQQGLASLKLISVTQEFLMTRHMTLATLLAMLPAAAMAQTLTPPAPAVAQAAIGPEIGAAAPAVTVLNTEGAPIGMTELAGPAGTIIAFNRSAAWCPFCKKQMAELESIKDGLAAAGWTLTALTYDTPDVLAGFAAKSNVTYPLLSDPGSATIKAFGLLNAEMAEGSRAYGVPHPAIVFITADGIVADVLREEGYKTRPAAEVVLARAEALVSAQ